MTGVGAIILAAGGSSRFGRPKQLAILNGVALVRRAADVVVEAGCSPVVVITGRDTEACRAALIGLPVTVVQNDDWQRGMGSSLRTGVNALLSLKSVTRAFVLLGDQPAVTVDTLRRLADAHTTAGTPVAIAAFTQTIGPPLVVNQSVLETLRDWPDDRGAKSLWEDRPELITRVPCPEATFDIDTPADLQRFVYRDVT